MNRHAQLGTELDNGVGEELYLEPDCPYCRNPHDVGDIFDGQERRCANCGKRIFAATFSGEEGDYMAMCPGETTPSSFELRPGRQRTRRLWRNRGRR